MILIINYSINPILLPPQATRARRSVELQYEEASARIKDLTTINVNLSNTKSKLEQELSVIAGDYDEVTKELRVRKKRRDGGMKGIRRIKE